jgi:lysophospholipase L1-like esterase
MHHCPFAPFFLWLDRLDGRPEAPFTMPRLHASWLPRLSLVSVFAFVGLVPAACAKRCPSPTPAPTSAPGPASRYVALGDSFTIGTGSSPERSFPAQVVAQWGDTALLNLGVNGYTTDDLMERELSEALAFRADFATLAIGANDIVHGADAETYRTHVRAIFAALAKNIAHCRIVALPQPDWSQSPTAREFGSESALAAKIRAFNGILKAEAQAAGARYLDLFPLMERQAGAHMLANDGLHPSAVAYREWADAIVRSLSEQPLPTTCP